MTLAALHHVEMCVANGMKHVSFFTDKLGFSLRAWRETALSNQWLVGSQRSAFLITEPKTGHCAASSPQREPFHVLCCEGQSRRHVIDSVFNVALEVKNVDLTTEVVTKHGGKLIQSPVDVTDSHGTARYSIVGSCCGNIVHTLLNKSAYSGPFLPTFSYIDNTQDKSLTTHIDHVTYVCRPGESPAIVDWYEKCFGMKKFLVNRTDDPLEGLVLRDRVGMRLRVMDYWSCAESGVCLPQEDANDGSSLKIVLAESLVEQESAHINAFLQQHDGPGLQHIGLHTSYIMECVQQMASKGLVFKKPPSAYYRQPGKLDEVKMTGLDAKKFTELGILIDPDADTFDDGGTANHNRFLLQLFTQPIFDRETFFLEVIQRKGARGFGAGNVTALARSIEEEEREKENVATVSVERQKEM